jgi:hypothetical protein
MTGYADTSFLVSLYVPDGNSAIAQSTAVRAAIHFPFTALHALETRNAIELNAFRNHITSAQAAQAWASVLTDIRSGNLVRQRIRWALAFRQPRVQAGVHTKVIGTRSLDILHVICARSVTARDFFSFDRRQRNLASALGFNVLP